MLSEIVKFNATDGLILYGSLYSPKRKTKLAMLYIHGLGGAFYGDLINALSEEAVRKGIAFMSMQTRGSYVIESFDYNTARPPLMAGSAMEKFEESKYDIAGAISFLKSRDYSNIVIIGKSTGCQKAAYYMSKSREKSVKGIVLISPVDDHNIDERTYGKRRFKRVIAAAMRLERKNPDALMESSIMAEDQHIISASRFLSTADLKRVEGRIFNYKLEKLSEFSRIRVPVFALFGSEDELLTLPPEEALRRLKENCSSSFSSAVIKGAGHSLFLNGKFPSKKIVSWAKRVLSSI